MNNFNDVKIGESVKNILVNHGPEIAKKIISRDGWSMALEDEFPDVLISASRKGIGLAPNFDEISEYLDGGREFELFRSLMLLRNREYLEKEMALYGTSAKASWKEFLDDATVNALTGDSAKTVKFIESSPKREVTFASKSNSPDTPGLVTARQIRRNTLVPPKRTIVS